MTTDPERAVEAARRYAAAKDDVERIGNMKSTPDTEAAYKEAKEELSIATAHLPKLVPALLDLMEWRPIETAPKDEVESFLVRVPKKLEPGSVVLQVSMFEGRLYPDHLEGCIDWDDAIEDATHWLPLLLPPPPVERKTHA